MDEVLTVKETAALLKVHPRTLRKLIAAKRVPFIKVGEQYRFSRAALQRYLDPKAEPNLQKQRRDDHRDRRKHQEPTKV